MEEKEGKTLQNQHVQINPPSDFVYSINLDR